MEQSSRTSPQENPDDKHTEEKTEPKVVRALWDWHHPNFAEDVKDNGEISYVILEDNTGEHVWRYCLIRGKVAYPPGIKPVPLLMRYGHLLVFASQKARYHYQMVCNPLDAEMFKIPRREDRVLSQVTPYPAAELRTTLEIWDLERMAELVRDFGSYAIVSTHLGGASEDFLHFQLYPPRVVARDEAVRPFRLIEDAIASAAQHPETNGLHDGTTIFELGPHPGGAGLVFRTSCPLPVTASKVLCDMAAEGPYNLFMRFKEEEAAEWAPIEIVFLPRNEKNEKPISEIEDLPRTPNTKREKDWKLGGPENCGSFHVPLDIKSLGDEPEEHAKWLTQSLEGIAGTKEELNRRLRDSLRGCLLDRA